MKRTQRSQPQVPKIFTGALAGTGVLIFLGLGVAACTPVALEKGAKRITHEVRQAPGGNDGGELSSSISVFDQNSPGVLNLKPELRSALQEAARAAKADGIDFKVTSGWRSPEFQNKLLQDAIKKYGSKEAASRWVAGADKSSHVFGDAVDIAPLKASSWLSQHGARYGLCQTYANESWHYELRPQAVAQGCPATYLDASADPRLR